MTAPARVALITGGNRGLGLAWARAALRRDVQVMLACRDPTLGEAAATALRAARPGAVVSVLELDLASLASVQRAVQALGARQVTLDALVCSAGTWRPSNRERTTDGLERTYATNHLGHAALTLGLLPQLTPRARIVFVSSALHDPGAWKGGPAVRYVSADWLAHPELDGYRDPSDAAAGSRAYATSKLCNVLFTRELARRLAAQGSALTVNAFNPGLMAGTGLNRGAPLGSRLAWHLVLPLLGRFIPGAHRPAQAAEALAALALGERHAAVSGGYFGVDGEETPSADATDPQKAADLWVHTLQTLHRLPDAPLPLPTPLTPPVSPQGGLP